MHTPSAQDLSVMTEDRLTFKVYVVSVAWLCLLAHLHRTASPPDRPVGRHKSLQMILDSAAADLVFKFKILLLS